MKNAFRIGLALGLLAVIVFGIGAIRDETGTVRYRSGATISFDTTTTVKDEDGGWTLNNSSFSSLAGLTSGTHAANTNNFTGTTNYFSGAATFGGSVAVTSNNTLTAASVTGTNTVTGGTVSATTNVVTANFFIGNSSIETNNVVWKVANYALSTNDVFVLISGNFTVTMPSPSSPAVMGKIITIQTASAGTNGILPNGAETFSDSGVQGAAKWTNTAIGKATQFFSNGTNWWVVGVH